ncbi:hypothetical protein SAMN02745674_02148 [Lysobacter spongiicola DSM 21749]|uniref:Uncharacterized protein n=1 Tax=Lysobacter spongiicola DSM 21749 TaxID=1122188 RepID=A0A1T4RF19_9GAMM|nr:hypothetical protein SAMN02745674_02148 [Lysobacter spongiicola DSM 21749]
MHQQDQRLEIASRLLSGIISQDRNRRLSERLDDIEHSLEVAAELIRRSVDGQSPPMAEHTLEPRPSTKTRERVIQRDAMPFGDRLQVKRGGSPNRPPRGPTLH